MDIGHKHWTVSDGWIPLGDETVAFLDASGVRRSDCGATSRTRLRRLFWKMNERNGPSLSGEVNK